MVLGNAVDISKTSHQIKKHLQDPKKGENVCYKICLKQAIHKLSGEL